MPRRLLAPLASALAICLIPQALAAADPPLPAQVAVRDVLVMPDGTRVVATETGLQRGQADGALAAVGPKGRALAIAADPVDGRLVAAVDRQLLVSADGGATWQSAGRPLPGGERALGIAVLGSRMVVSTTGGGVLRWDGRAWQRAIEGIPPAIGGQPAAPVPAIAMMPGEPDGVVGVTETMQVIRSQDAGATWTGEVAGAGTPEGWRVGRPRLVAAGPSLPRTAYLARGMAIAGPDSVRWLVMRTDDAGATWRPIAKDWELHEPVLWLRPMPDDPQSLEVGTASEVRMVSAR